MSRFLVYMPNATPHIPDATQRKEVIIPISNVCAKDANLFLQYWQIVKDNTYAHSWRALWVIDYALKKDKSHLDLIIDELYDLLLKTNNNSLLRLGLKIIVLKPIPVNDTAGALLNKCEDLLLNRKIPVGTRVNCLQYIFEFCKAEPDLFNELEYLIDLIKEQNNTAAMKCRIRDIRKEMKQYNN